VVTDKLLLVVLEKKTIVVRGRRLILVEPFNLDHHFLLAFLFLSFYFFMIE
jgi:hypothetical protein